jgi:hypothetical protein
MRIEIIQMAYLDRQTMAANEATTQKKKGPKNKNTRNVFRPYFYAMEKQICHKKSRKRAQRVHFS